MLVKLFFRLTSSQISFSELTAKIKSTNFSQIKRVCIVGFICYDLCINRYQMGGMWLNAP
ncbi:MAG: hypothetical protein A4E44_00961 [Methanosaeta sp. PtaB.Bin018]|nr:MAG: hypothetical protein A4E44_00961 [Methanosaeta sp. PtaB.Bin018]OPY43843.1 MAG: hypothetical protein A4E46_01639 [Methanosaeta sp. PtaU1.Bin016]